MRPPIEVQFFIYWFAFWPLTLPLFAGPPKSWIGFLAAQCAWLGLNLPCFFRDGRLRVWPYFRVPGARGSKQPANMANTANTANSPNSTAADG